ncbi:TPA: hypothetical protein NKS49_004583 [Vibrio parahaemolyticus]|nr:hypothetical protein [Vibrio parahaemolyticus]
MDWFLKVFAEPRQQAQLVSIVVSALMAIFILLLNQWFSNLKMLKELRIEKIESLYISINEYESELLKLISLMFSQKADDEECLKSYFSASSYLQSIKMYFSLHFSEIEVNFHSHDEFLKKVDKELSSRYAIKTVPRMLIVSDNLQFSFYTHRKALNKVHENCAYMKEATQKAMNKLVGK